MPLLCRRTTLVLNQTEAVALRELLRRADQAGIEITVWSYEDGQRQIEILVGDLLSRIILQTKVEEEAGL
jgi:hypothetical protein